MPTAYGPVPPARPASHPATPADPAPPPGFLADPAEPTNAELTAPPNKIRPLSIPRSSFRTRSNQFILSTEAWQGSQKPQLPVQARRSPFSFSFPEPIRFQLTCCPGYQEIRLLGFGGGWVSEPGSGCRECSRPQRLGVSTANSKARGWGWVIKQYGRCGFWATAD